MKKTVYTLLMIFAALLCLSCSANIQFDETRPGAFLERPDIINLPIIKSENGLILVPTSIDEGDPVLMIIDTGATRSAIYQSFYQRLGLEKTHETVQIHGMVESGIRPEIQLPYLDLDNKRIENLTFAVLEKFAQKSKSSDKIGGLIGLDILDSFYLFFDHERQILSLIPIKYPPPILPSSWSRVVLSSNPYIDDGRTLKYFNVRVTGQLVPALFDTGSEFNLINWPAIKHPHILTTRRKLEDQWRLAGAVGKFDPRTKVKLVGFRSDQKFWSGRDFLVLDFESLHKLGVKDRPFIIAGTNMFTKSTFWLDLRGGEIVFKPGSDDRSISDEVVLTSF